MVCDFPYWVYWGKAIRHYSVSIAQVYPIRICRLMAFELVCKQAKVKSSLTLFRQFYQMKGMGGMFYFATRPKRKDFLGACADLSGRWRMRYLMVSVANFPSGMG